MIWTSSTLALGIYYGDGHTTSDSLTTTNYSSWALSPPYFAE